MVKFVLILLIQGQMNGDCWLANIHSFRLSANYNNMQTAPTKLIEHVRLAINPKFHHWVLFSNGTYIIIEDATIQDRQLSLKRSCASTALSTSVVPPQTS
jgi:hypothetical protein